MADYSSTLPDARPYTGNAHVFSLVRLLACYDYIYRKHLPAYMVLPISILCACVPLSSSHHVVLISTCACIVIIVDLRPSALLRLAQAVSRITFASVFYLIPFSVRRFTSLHTLRLTAEVRGDFLARATSGEESTVKKTATQTFDQSVCGIPLTRAFGRSGSLCKAPGVPTGPPCARCPCRVEAIFRSC